MKEAKPAIRCSGCSHCSSYRYIHDYFLRKNMLKMPCFIGFGAKYSEAVPVKTAPAWCPEKKAQK